MEKREVELNREVVQHFGIAKVFRDNSEPINSLDFRADGEILVTSSQDESLHVYQVNEGKMSKKVLVKRYGVNLVRFTHSPNAVIAASNNKFDEAIRYLSLHDNRYLRYFKAHRDKVVSLEMSPLNDGFISGSLDKTVRLWDLRTNACQGYINVNGRPAVAYDPEGMVCAIASEGNVVKLYDARNYDKGPFSTFQANDQRPLTWTSLCFSPDGKKLLLSSDTSKVMVLDAFEGTLEHVFASRVNEHKTALATCFSPDSQFVLSGSEDGAIHVWDAKSGEQLARWTGHSQATTAVAWCPRRMMVATASTKLAFWLPDYSRLRDEQHAARLRASQSKNMQP